MTVEEVFDYFPNKSKLCAVLGLCRQNANYWQKKGKIPHVQQMKIEKLTNGQLKADEMYSDLIEHISSRSKAK
jgi:predicted site-specific integrase-resolvase